MRYHLIEHIFVEVGPAFFFVQNYDGLCYVGCCLTLQAFLAQPWGLRSSMYLQCSFDGVNTSVRPLYKGVISNMIVQLFVLKRYIVQILVSKILCLCYQRMMKFWLSLIKKWQSLDCFLEETMQLQAHIWNQLPCFNWLSLLALCYLTTLRWWLMHMVKKSIDLQISSFLSWEFQTF